MNSDADLLWQSLFPVKQYVHINDFISSFESFFSGHHPNNVPSEVPVCRLLLVAGLHDEDMEVSKSSFRNFIKLFGPVRKCLENIAKNLYISSDDNNDEYVVVPWYHGCISRANAEKILITKSPLAGDFLVRISESQAGKFTISYVGSNRQFKNILIKNNEDGGYALHPEGDETFDSISDIISKNSRKLRNGIPSDLHLESFKYISDSGLSTDIAGLKGNSRLHASSIERKEEPHPSLESPYGCFTKVVLGLSPRCITENVKNGPPSDYRNGDDIYGTFSAKTINRSNLESSLPKPQPSLCSSSTYMDTSQPPELSRRDLSSNLDESRHLMKENKFNEALGVAESVIENIAKQYEKPDDMKNEYLLLIAKAFFEKGNIKEGLSAEALKEQECLSSYEESCSYLDKLFCRCESSDRLIFDEFSLFAKLHRKIADIYARLDCVEKAEHHYAACSGLMLQDPNSDVEARSIELVGHIKHHLPSCMSSVDEASSYLDNGISEYKKGKEKFEEARNSMLKALRCSRVCGATEIELRAVANLGTVEAAMGRYVLAANYYDQYCILCPLIKKGNDATLKNIMYLKSKQLVSAGLCHKAIKCINESLNLICRKDNVNKLEALKRKAHEKLGHHHQT